jgi:hypothetical protein
VSIDLRALIRKHKPHKRLARLAERDRQELVDAASVRITADTKILPDTNIYIREAAGTEAVPGFRTGG